MTPNHLLSKLTALPGDHALIFETPAGPIGRGYHITELKHARITSIDCGGRIAEWQEASLQLLDGAQGAPLTVGKAAAIITQSLARVPGLKDSPLHVEFAHGNQGLKLYHLSDPRPGDGTTVLHLTDAPAQCKPAAEHAQAPGKTACCTPAPAVCCT